MRVKKQKRHRKVVRFYSSCFGFREPYKILCDGTFIHHLHLHRLTPADDTIAHLLGACALLFTTRCIIGELRSLGDSHSEALEAAQQLITASLLCWVHIWCDHEKRVNAVTCIDSIIGETNSEHFFIATQDADVREKFREVPGVPVIYGLRNSLFFEQPSAQQRQFVKMTEEKCLHMNETEYLNLNKRDPNDEITNNSRNDDENGTHLKRKVRLTERMLGVSESKFKRKRTKGPNPLSCKKKKKDDPSVKNQDGAVAGVAKKNRIRKRKRSKEIAS